MKIVKYQKLKGNEYKVITDTSSYVLYDDIIIKYCLKLILIINYLIIY